MRAHTRMHACVEYIACMRAGPCGCGVYFNKCHFKQKKTVDVCAHALFDTVPAPSLRTVVPTTAKQLVHWAPRHTPHHRAVAPASAVD